MMTTHDIILKKLTAITGIGNTLAEKLIDNGIVTTQQLKKHINELPEVSRIYLKYDICKKIDREYITELLSYLPKNWIAVGSYRREQVFSRDIDFLTTNDLQYESDMLNIISNVGGAFGIISEFQKGNARRSFILSFRSLNVQIDLFNTSPENLPFALFHYTGNKIFNIETRLRAKKMGYKLNQYGLFKGDKRINLKTEREIFKFLNIKYKKPREREE